MPMFRYLLRSFIVLLVRSVDLPRAGYRESEVVQAPGRKKAEFMEKSSRSSGQQCQ
jgi:hypothetical protein